MNLAGKSALITGGGSGIGADLARGFAEAGAAVVIAGRRLDALEAVARKTGARAVQADVTDEQSVARLFMEAGPCDIVIANAGAAESAPFARTSLTQWHAMLGVNLTGTFLTFREGLKQMQGWGRLIAIASIAGLRGYPYVAPYVAAKHGVVGLTRAVALEVAQREITVNAICPGYVATEMTDRSVAHIRAKTGMNQAQALGALTKTSPQNRLIEPAEITSLALWLCSADARGMNGQALSLAGGEG
ncbi:MAG: SDR family oxidoreductase [Methylobacterium sp.]|nr:SDR family oxidoreductase [Methylobacterium sp.]MCA3653323.1 SDR family oxidoreductase [Methylobacterium sp.]MCA4924293.1 SDR family oxidoreductase [Methylobacterium sp.]